jgi:hypothetical protein
MMRLATILRVLTHLKYYHFLMAVLIIVDGFQTVAYDSISAGLIQCSQVHRFVNAIYSE